MRLYHGSNHQIREIDLAKRKDHKDFGRGFYMTQDFSRAVAMAQRTTSIEGAGSPEVNHFNPDNTSDLIDSEIVAPLPTKLNRLKKTNIEAYYYWSEVQKLMQWLGESSENL